MRFQILGCLVRVLGLSCVLLLFAPRFARCAPEDEQVRVSVTSPGPGSTAQIADPTDQDRQPIRRPPDWEPSFWGQHFRQGIVAPLSHVFDIPDKLLWVARAFRARTQREAVNVNAFDEAPNSTWFTNRNHVRAVPVAQLRQGPDSLFLPAKPWTIKHAKRGGWSPGFQIKDANGSVTWQAR